MVPAHIETFLRFESRCNKTHETPNLGFAGSSMLIPLEQSAHLA